MATYKYLATDEDGRRYKGTLDAPNEEAVRKKLSEAGLSATSINKEKAPFFNFKKPITNENLVTFSQQLADLIGAGIPLLKSLKALQRQIENPTLKDIVKDIEFHIEAGSTFSSALARHPKVFSEFFISMVRAGETGGVLSKVLDRLALHLERSQGLRQKVKSAFAYPVLVGILTCIVSVFLVIVIIPVFASVYTKLNIILPGPTLALMAISRIIKQFWWLILFIVAALIFLYINIKSQLRFRKMVDGVKIRMPIFGKLNRLTAVSRFVRTFGDMLTSGVVAMEALDVANKVTGNILVSEIVGNMKSSVQKGHPVSDVLQDQDIFPQTTVQMMMAGEESGTLGEMLEKNANTMDRDIDYLVKRLVTIIEPLMTAILAGIVGFIAMAVYFPVFDLIQQVSGG